MKLRLLTWNLHDLPAPLTPDPRGRIEAVIPVLGRHQPDVVLLQEVWMRGHAARIIDSLASDYVPIAETGSITMIDPLLPILGQLALPLAGVLRMRKSGLMAMVRKDWRIVGEPGFETFDCEAADWRVIEQDAHGAKGYQWFSIERGGDRVVIVNTHLQSQYSWNAHFEVRRAQIHQLMRLVDRQSPAVPLLLAGDFNTAPGCEPGRHPECCNEACHDDLLHREMTEGWEDLTAARRQRCLEAHEGWGCTTNYTDQAWIDYVWARRSPAFRFSADIEMLLNAAQDDPYSDHQGILADIAIAFSSAAALSTIEASALMVLAGDTTRRDWLGAVATLAASYAGRVLGVVR